MKSGWQIVPMGQLCSISSGESDTQDAVEDGPYAFFDRSRTIKRSSRFLYDCEALIIPGEGKEFLPRHFSGKFDLHQRAYALFGFSDQLSARFLYFFLHHARDYLPSVAVGATVKSLRRRHFEQLPVAVTSLPEQQRIAGILDEAFAGIATAKANAEKNLQNAHALFESHLHAVFTHHGPGWVERPLEACIEKVRYTSKIQRKDFLETGRFPIVSQEAEFINGYWNNEADLFRPERPLVVFGDHTRTLKFIDFDFVLGADGVKLLLPSPSIDGKFFFYALLAVPIPSLGYARHYRVLAERSVAFPVSLPEQRRITARLDALQTETRRLEALYAKKLAALDELKSALLHQAFSGQL